MEPKSELQSKQTILIVDDDAAVLRLVAESLADKFDILTANSSDEALRQSNDFKKEIHLLLSDVQMPGMTGIDLATRITAQRPKIKVLLMSGYTGGMLVLNEGWHFLSKPFIPSQLRVLVAGLISPAKSRFSAA
jgi:two-component system cell cycle sensor histidine kinase/response regulator CckA